MMRRGLAKYFYIFLFICCCFIPSRAQVIEQDSLALIDFFNATGGNDWLIPWDTSRTVTEWFGVVLNEDNSRVEGISLPNNQVTGELPLTISSLQKLTTLDLSDNQISGEIPDDFGNLDTLIVLDLSGNSFTNNIPISLGALRYLKTLDLSGNAFQGTIPGALSNLDSLRILNLSQNQFSGEVPSSLVNLDSINVLNLSANDLSGPVPDFIRNLKELREIDLSSNTLDGVLPDYWGELEKLRILRLDENDIEGEIPGQIGDFKTLFQLDLSNNNLVGALPSTIGSIDSLRTLDVSGNVLDSIPSTISGLPKIEVLDLSENAFEGNLPLFSATPQVLKKLDFHDNKFNGSIPSDYGDILTLEELNLANNNLTDSLPDNILNLLALKILDLSNNKISSLIDITELGESGNLQQFDVSGNNLEFDDLELNFQLFNDSLDYAPQARINDTLNVAVPTGNFYTLMVEAEGNANEYRWVLESEDSLVQIDYHPSLFEYTIDDFQEENSGTYTCEIINTNVPGLVLKRNPINLFPAINTIDSLALIQLNKATGGTNWDTQWNIESEPVFTWEGVEIESGTVVGLELKDNNLQGYLSDSIGLLANIRVLDLSGNNLVDTIPQSLGELKKLTRLDLSNNSLEGRIPDSIGELDSLQVLNFSRNQLEGPIPGSISGLKKLQILDLSRNDLDSTITNQFDSLLLLKELNLSDNDLSDTIPSNLNKLVLLESLILGDNRFVGEIPLELGTLINLVNLDLSENRLTGEIPAEIAGLPKLEELKLFRNQLSGGLPEEFTNSTSIERLFINDNNLNALPKFSDDQFDILELRVFNNVLTFDDLVDNFNGFNNAEREDEFLFLPQPTLINKGTITLEKDQSITLEIPDSHPDNRYRWSKGTILEAKTRELVIDSAQVLSSGTYIGEVWTNNQNFREEINTITDSLIFSFSFTVLVPPSKPDIEEPSPFCIGDETVTLVNDFNGQAGLVSRWFDIHPEDGGVPFSESPLIIHQINQESDTLYVTNGLAVNKSFESAADTVVIISRPWIIDKGEFLEAAPSDSLIRSRFPDDLSNSSYQWFFNEMLMPGETGSTIQKTTEGKYHVRVIRGKCSSTSVEFIPPNSDLVLGLGEDLNSRIVIYPNPANEVLTINGLESLKGDLTVYIINMNGKALFVEKMGVYMDKSFLSVDVSGLPGGVYVFRAVSDSNQVTRKFIKK